MKAEAKKHIAKCEAEDLCQACSQPFVGDEKRVRRTHERCRQAQRRLIAAGIETEESLVAKGEVAEKKDGGRKPSNPVTKRARGITA